MLEAPMDQFLAFSEAAIQAREKDFAAAEASVERGIVVFEMFKLKVMEIYLSMTRAVIADEHADYVAMADFYLEALDRIEHSVIAGELQVAVPRFMRVSQSHKSGAINWTQLSDRLPPGLGWILPNPCYGWSKRACNTHRTCHNWHWLRSIMHWQSGKMQMMTTSWPAGRRPLQQNWVVQFSR